MSFANEPQLPPKLDLATPSVPSSKLPSRRRRRWWRWLALGTLLVIVTAAIYVVGPRYFRHRRAVAEFDNAVADLAAGLDGDYDGCHVSTMRRKFFNRPGRLYSTPEALIVYLDRFAEQEALLPEIDRVNAQRHRIPWLDDRLLVISVTPPGHQGPGP